MNEKSQKKNSLLNRIMQSWHIRRAVTLTRKLEIQTKFCEMLRAADRRCQSFYYMDQLHLAECKLIKITWKKKYHSDRVTTF